MFTELVAFTKAPGGREILQKLYLCLDNSVSVNLFMDIFVLAFQKHELA